MLDQGKSSIVDDFFKKASEDMADNSPKLVSYPLKMTKSHGLDRVVERNILKM